MAENGFVPLTVVHGRGGKRHVTDGLCEKIQLVARRMRLWFTLFRIRALLFFQDIGPSAVLDSTSPRGPGQFFLS
jgi:hypothetical protein